MILILLLLIAVCLRRRLLIMAVIMVTPPPPPSVATPPHLPGVSASSGMSRVSIRSEAAPGFDPPPEREQLTAGVSARKGREQQ